MSLLFPPSLPFSVRSRAFHARNGELGIALADAIAFLDACANDQAEVLGWELWLIGHRWDDAANESTSAPGIWCGLIPVEGTSVPAVFQGSGDCEQTRLEISRLDRGEIALQYRDYIRINFTLAD